MRVVARRTGRRSWPRPGCLPLWAGCSAWRRI